MKENLSNRTAGDQKNKWNPWSTIVWILVLVSLLGIGIGIGISLNNQTESNPNSGGVRFDPKQGGYVDSDLGNCTPSQGVAIPGWGVMTIPANQRDITVDFYNPKQNEGRYYLTFELRLPDGNGGYEVLYRSGLIEAGNHIQKITLSRSLEKGTYDAVIFVQPYRMDGVTPTNNLETQTRLIVK